MAPVLFDIRGLIKLGIGLILLILLVFVSGFTLGYHKASSDRINETTRLGLKLPLSKSVSAAALAPQIPLKIAPGIDIDVDEPDRGSAQKPEEKFESVAANALAVTKKLINPIQPVGISAKVKKALSHTEELVSQTRIYTIQVGVYQHHRNAENLLKSLQARGLNAYLADFLTKNHQRRYNVRFGYYANKKQARQALKAYRKESGGTGYLLRRETIFHAKNNIIINANTDKTTEF